ncbi:MAG TPA: hypothetical protein VJZ49_02660 [Syntrophales bacterium]|nr:hypothetical protein [Syntrophales bacterium]
MSIEGKIVPHAYVHLFDLPFLDAQSFGNLARFGILPGKITVTISLDKQKQPPYTSIHRKSMPYQKTEGMRRICVD